MGLPAKDPEAITKWYDALSNNYDELYGEEQAQKHTRVLSLLGNDEFNIILDLGCGTGRLLKLLSSRTQTAVGIDLSFKMLAIAKRSADGAIQFIRADSAHLPLRNRIADGVVSVSMAESGPTSSQHLNEVSRVASDQATLVITIFGSDDQIIGQPLAESSIELVACISDRERLYLRRGRKRQVDSSALV
jgi:ArsR family transcriptional regulator